MNEPVEHSRPHEPSPEEKTLVDSRSNAPPASERDATAPLRLGSYDPLTSHSPIIEQRTEGPPARPQSFAPLPPPVEHANLVIQHQERALLSEMFGIESEPAQLEHYELLEELGRGGMGVVHAAHDPKLDRKVAIKQLLVHTSSTAMRRAFLSEARAMAKLAHPNVVSIYEIGEGPAGAFIVMEHVEGVTLQQWLDSEPRSLSARVAVLQDAGRGLAAAHAKGLVHRDFKPANVMVGEDRRVRMMDFGLARPDPQHAETSRLAGVSSRSGALVGTPAYMAPEQLRGQWADARSDQFAYCVTFYQALYGQRPFLAHNLAQLCQATESGVLPTPPFHAEVPTWLHELVIRGLQPKPSARFPSMTDLLETLEAGVAQGGLEGVPPRWVFVVHDPCDKLAVARVCEGLIDHGIRPWLDIWDLEPTEDTHTRARALLSQAPAVLICTGERGLRGELGPEPALEAALAARLETAPSSVHHLHLPGAPARIQGPDECALLTLDETSWAEGIAELAMQIGVDHKREDWLDEEAAAAGVPRDELTPYRGLAAFGERDARWMFGRERELGELIELLRAGETWLTLVGASGSGKSSLVMAGLCPLLRRGVLEGPGWRIAQLRPGQRPCEALALALVELSPHAKADPLLDALQATELRERLLASPEAAARVLRLLAAAEGEEKRILLVVDQLEELFTEARLGHDDHAPAAMAFVRNLLRAAQGDTPLRIVATMRADFIQRGLEIPGLAQTLKSGAYFALPPVSEAQLRAVIGRPMRRVGFELEPRLTEKLISAAAGHAGQLPLLQHALHELWQRRDPQRRLLPHSVYAETGGVEGAIALAAERALDGLRAQLGDEAQLLTRQVMTRLVHLGQGDAGHTRRRVSMRELGVDARTRLVIEIFVRDARVLVATNYGGEEVLEIAHEALLREWSTLVAWLEADCEALRLRQELARDAGEWRGRDDEEYLWEQGRVEEVKRVLRESTVELNDFERSFLDASQRRVRRGWLRVRLGLSILVAVVLGSVVLLWVNYAAQRETELLKDTFTQQQRNLWKYVRKEQDLEIAKNELIIWLLAAEASAETPMTSSPFVASLTEYLERLESMEPPQASDSTARDNFSDWLEERVELPEGVDALTIWKQVCKDCADLDEGPTSGSGEARAYRSTCETIAPRCEDTSPFVSIAVEFMSMMFNSGAPLFPSDAPPPQ